MLIELKKSTLTAIDDVSLIWTCIEPTIRQIRGKSFKVKSEASAELNEGQKALLMFQMLYGHSGGGVLELFSHMSYLLSEKGVWALLKKGMLYFGDQELFRILEQMEALYHLTARESMQVDGLQASEKDSCPPDIQPSSLDKQLFKLLPKSIKIVGSYIRNHPEVFIHLVDD